MRGDHVPRPAGAAAEILIPLTLQALEELLGKEVTAATATPGGRLLSRKQEPRNPVVAAAAAAAAARRSTFLANMSHEIRTQPVDDSTHYPSFNGDIDTPTTGSVEEPVRKAVMTAAATAAGPCASQTRAAKSGGGGGGGSEAENLPREHVA